MGFSEEELKVLKESFETFDKDDKGEKSLGTCCVLRWDVIQSQLFLTFDV